MTDLLAIGTDKGLLLARSTDQRRSWELGELQFPMNAVYAVGVDRRRSTPRLLIGVDSSHFGPSVLVSDDLGESWTEADHAPISFPEDTGTSLTRVWQFAAASEAEPDVVYAGTQPSALFRSEDGGLTYELVRSLWDHPHRPEWGEGFGGQAIHTIVPHPQDPDQLLVAMSTGGVYRTDDGRASWAPANQGIKAYFFPDPWPEFGQCVHKVAQDVGNPDRLYAQNHHGVYRTDDRGGRWESIADGLPSDFGFPILAHPSTPDVLYTFPLKADGDRRPVDQKCAVFRSTDAGGSWERLDAGLPDAPFYPSVLRDAMCADQRDPAGVYFGSRSGEVFGSRDEGDSWTEIAAHLPDVLCLRAVSL